MIKVTSSIDWNRWDDFVYSHPKGNIFQTSCMANVYKLTQNYEPVSLAVVDLESNDIIAVLQAVIVRQMGGIFSVFSSRSIIYGGPIYDEKKENSEAIRMLIEEYEKVIASKVIYTEIRNMWDTRQIRDIIEQNGYSLTDHFNALIDLNKPVDELWNQLKRDKKRGIKKSEELGITIERSQSKESIKVFYELVKETYNKAKVPLAPISFFEAAFEILVPKQKALLLFARDNVNNVIATQFALMYKDRIYAWYTGSREEYLKFHPGDALIWYLLKYGSEHGYKVFDFGGGGGPNKNENLREYKSRFGTEFPCYGRYEKTYSETRSKIANTSLKIYKRLI
jgi:lipid II:glycine glycyltransferase (peptidoglycan interpeptide bridge formation enzyme)